MAVLHDLQLGKYEDDAQGRKHPFLSLQARGLEWKPGLEFILNSTLAGHFHVGNNSCNQAQLSLL